MDDFTIELSQPGRVFTCMARPPHSSRTPLCRYAAKSRFTQDVHLPDRVFELNSLLHDIMSAVIEELETMLDVASIRGGE